MLTPKPTNDLAPDISMDATGAANPAIELARDEPATMLDAVAEHDRGDFKLLAVVSSSHLVVDTVAGQMSPLWPELSQHYDMPSTSGCLLVWTLATSVFQLLFGVLGDSMRGQWLMIAGPMVAVGCLSAIGLTHSPPVLYALLLFAGLGIAAYHPEAAAMSGRSWSSQRSRAMSIFAMGGYLGQAIGPYYSGYMVDRWGLRGLAWGAAWGWLAMLAVAVGLGRQPVAHVAASEPRWSPWKSLHTCARRLTLLLAIGSLRIVAAAGVPIALGFVLAQRNWLKSDVGLVQSAFMAGIGAAGLICALSTSARWERRTLWLPSLLTVPILLILPRLDGPLLHFATLSTGFLLGLALPVLISTGQRMLPESPRVASSITMGVSWGIGGGIVSGIIDLCERWQAYDAAFAGFAVATTLSSLLCIALPSPAAVHPARD